MALYGCIKEHKPVQIFFWVMKLISIDFLHLNLIVFKKYEYIFNYAVFVFSVYLLPTLNNNWFNVCSILVP